MVGEVDFVEEDRKPRDKIFYSTGASRTNKVEKVAYWLLPRAGIKIIAQRFFEGIAIHGEDNWKKGQPRKVILNHMMDHLLKYIDGDRTDNHLGAIGWGVCAIAWFDEQNIEIDNQETLGEKKNEV